MCVHRFGDTTKPSPQEYPVENKEARFQEGNAPCPPRPQSSQAPCPRGRNGGLSIPRDVYRACYLASNLNMKGRHRRRSLPENQRKRDCAPQASPWGRSFRLRFFEEALQAKRSCRIRNSNSQRPLCSSRPSESLQGSSSPVRRFFQRRSVVHPRRGRTATLRRRRSPGTRHSSCCRHAATSSACARLHTSLQKE